MSQHAPEPAADAEPSWDHFRALLWVLRTGSLSGAARVLGLTQPTLRRQIEALEEALGAPLFTRSPAGLHATALAGEALPQIEALASGAAALWRTLSGGTEPGSGVVRVTCSEIVGAEVLPPILAALQRRHPMLQIELSPTNQTEDLLRRDADIAVRMTRPAQAALLARRVGAVELGLFASAAYLASRPAPRVPAELAARHRLVGGDRDRALLDALRAVGIAVERRDLALCCDSDLGQFAAVRAGLGIGVCQVPLAAASSLVRVLPELRFELEVFVVMHEDLRASPRVTLVFQHLCDALAAYLRRP